MNAPHLKTYVRTCTALRMYPEDPVLGALNTIGENFFRGANNAARGITGLTAVLNRIGEDGG